MGFSEYGFAFADGYLIDEKGNKRFKSYIYDNGPDYLVEGLMRYRGEDEKVGFLDACLNAVIPADYDFATPFKDGTSVVCNGCEPVPIHDDEHFTMEGGLWGQIDAHGNIITPVKYSKAELKALVKK